MSEALALEHTRSMLSKLLDENAFPANAPLARRSQQELSELLDERDKASRKLDSILANAEKREDGALTDHETELFNAARDKVRELEPRIERTANALSDIRDLRLRNEARSALARDLQPEETPLSEQKIHRGGVISEARTYHPDSEHSFFHDLITERSNWEARDRLERHRHETRDVGTGDFGNGLVPPQYLPEKFAKVLRAGRVTANLAANMSLPAHGMEVTVPRGTTGTVTASQSDENTSVTEQNFASTDLTIPVRTIAGQQDVSRQTIERGIGTDAIVFADLVADYNRTLDSQIINGDGTNGTHLGILSTTSTTGVTLGTAGFPALQKAIVNASVQISANRFQAPDVIVMHPRRWGYCAVQTDSDGRPLVDLEGGGSNMAGQGNLPGEGFVGSIAGLPVFIDANIPTAISSWTGSAGDEDAIIVARRDDLLLWEDAGRAPARFRFDETLAGQLTIKLVTAGYSAFTAGWNPAGIAVITGSQLLPPTF